MKWSTGINLFDISQAEIGKSTSWGATAGTEIMVANSKIGCLTIIDALPSTTYTVKNFTPGKIWLSRIIEANEDGLGYVNHKHYSNLEQALIQKTITTSANTTKLYITMQTIDGANISADTLKDVQIMIVQGNAIGDYEPYDDGVPKLYGDKVNVEVRGKNLFDNSADISKMQYYKLPIQMKKGAKLTMSFIGVGTGSGAVKAYCHDSELNYCNTLFYFNAKSGVNKYSSTITCSGREKNIFFYKTEFTKLFEKIYDIQIEINDVATDYTPYRESQSLSISTPTGLPAIPVDSDGNYTDANGQQWIADYVDLKRGKYVQRVWQKTFDGSESWGTYITTGYYLADILPEKMCNREMLCNQLRRGDGGIASDIIIVGAFKANSTIYIENCTLRDNTLVDKGLSNWKTHLAEHPLVIMTYLDEPIERDLTPEEIQAYKNLVTYAGTTIVENDAECYMEVSAGGGDALRAKKLALLLGE